MQCVPVTMQAVVMEILCPFDIVLLGVCDGHAHDTCANGTLQKSLAFELLALSFSDSQHIVAKLAVEVFNLLFQTESAFAFATLNTEIHFFENKLSLAIAFVMHIGCSILCESPHLIYVNCVI